MLLVTVFGNKLNRQSSFFFLGWGKYALYVTKISVYLNIINYVLSQVIGPAIPIVAHTVAIAHEEYGTGYQSVHLCIIGFLFRYIYDYSTVVGLTQIVEHLQHSLSPLWPLCWQLSLQQNYVNVHKLLFQKTLYNLCSNIQTSQLYFILIIAVAGHIHSYTSVLIQQHSYNSQRASMYNYIAIASQLDIQCSCFLSVSWLFLVSQTLLYSFHRD